jgi:acyl-CoA synthetase (AMP-forming)/AMP-acid ligase II
MIDTRMPCRLLHLGEVLSTNARLFADKIGVRDLDRSMNFRLWNERACRLANALHGLGLGKGDRVAVLAYNCLEWAEIYAATAKAGLVAVPINFRLLGREIRYIVENCDAAALIVQDELAGVIEEIRSDIPIAAQNYIHFGGRPCPAGFRAYEDLLASSRDSEPGVPCRRRTRGC